MRVLIIKRDKLGDLLLTTPMLAWLRQALPEAEIHVLANDYNAWVLTGNPDVDKVWAPRRVRHAGRVRLGAALQNVRELWRVRQLKFDWVLVGNGDESKRAIKRGLIVKGQRTVAYVDHPQDWPALSHPIPAPNDEHESVRLARLAERLGLTLPAALPAPRYTLPEADRAFAQQWLARQGLPAGGYVIIGLGARRLKKQPSASQVLAWAQAIHARWGLQTVFMWTPGKRDNRLYPGDDELAEQVLAAQSPLIHPFQGQLNEVIGVIWHARTSIFPDSGLMHFAAASPGGVLGFFAEPQTSAPPARWAPLGPRSRWLEAPHAVTELSDEQVLGSLAELLA